MRNIKDFDDKSPVQKLASFDIEEMHGDPEYLREFANQLEFNARMKTFLKTDEGKKAIVEVVQEAKKNKQI